jgi:2-polyprenyl-3-methyl-5-hydroxy-6-metoxy-1,4-benzoquinol methylase
MKISGFRAMLYNRFHREEVYSRAEYWDAKANELKGHAVSMWRNERLNDLYTSEVAEVFDGFLPDARDMVIMDLGCGTGRGSQYLAKRGARVTGIDFAAKAIKIARSDSPMENTTFRVQSMFEIDDILAFDRVVSWGSIAIACRNRDDLLNVMVRLYRSLKPGGGLLLMEPIHRGFLHRVLRLTQSEFIDVMRTAGFRIDNVVNLHFWPARLALAYVRWPKFITDSIYHTGQWIMRVLFGNVAFGDYTAISATKDISVVRERAV